MRRALEIVRLICEDTDEGRSRDMLSSFSEKLRSCHPSMELLTGLSATVLKFLDNSDFSEVRKNLIGYADSMSSEMDTAILQIADRLQSFLEPNSTVITLSVSETVTKTVELLHSRGIIKEVIISESRPVNEGVSVAEYFSKAGIRTCLVVDAALPSMAEFADVAVIGADRAFSDGSVANKIGSRALALACKREGVPFYVVCETGKLTFSNATSFVQEQMPPSEVYSGKKMKNLSVRNFYFELVESDLLSGIVTEKSVINSRE